jgi:hypothetical protein
MSRTLLGAAAVGAAFFGAPYIDVADLNLVADVSAVNAVPELSNWAMLGLGFVSIGFAGSTKRKDGRIAI